MKSVLEDVVLNDTSSGVSKLKTTDDYIKLLRSKGINTEELAPILKAKGVIGLLATAGAGKSTALAHIYIHDKLMGDLKTAEDKTQLALVSTFLRNGAEDLERTIKKTIGDLELFNLDTLDTTFKNLHAEFRTLLTLAGVKIANKPKEGYMTVMDNRVQYDILGKLFRDFELGQNPNYANQMEMNSLLGILEKYRNTVISQFTFGGLEKTAEDLKLRLDMMPKLVETYAELRDRFDVIDFTDMIELVYKYYANPETRNPKLYKLYTNRYRYLLLDEFQDLSELQYLALKPILGSCNKVVVCGDDDQSIYGFQGASPKVFKWFEHDFKATMLPLSVSYRCPDGIFNPIVRSIKHNQNRFDKKLKAYKTGGICQANTFLTLKAMSDQTVNVIHESVKSGKTVTVISRTNYTYSPAMINYALKYGANFNLLGTMYDLNKAKYKRVWNLIEMVRGRGVKDLAKNLRILDPSATNWHTKDLQTNLANTLTEGQSVLTYLDDIAKICNNSKSFNALNEKIEVLANAKNGNVLEMDVFKLLLQHVKYFGRPTDAEVVDTLMALAEVSGTPREFIETKDYINAVLQDAQRNKHGVSNVTFATVHGFKGNESDVVIVFNASDGVFPSELSSDDDYEEERSMFFVAGTRATKECYYYALENHVSPYLLETALPLEKVALVQTIDEPLKSNTETLKERIRKNTAKGAEDVDIDDFDDFVIG